MALGVLIIVIIVVAILLILYSNSNPAPTNNRFTGTLNGSKVNPPTLSNAIGQFSGQLIRDQLDYNLIIQSISDNPVAYIGYGNPKQNGHLLKMLHFKPINNLTGTHMYQAKGIWKKTDMCPLTDRAIKELIAGNLYIQVANSIYEDGEIRSQIRRLA